MERYERAGSLECMDARALHAECGKLCVLSFVAMVSTSLYNLALPNIWIFHVRLDPSIIGTISMAYTMAYLLGPLLFKKLARRRGLKVSLLLSVSTSIVGMALQLVIIDVTWLFVINAANGLFDSMYWPSVHARLACLKSMLPGHVPDGIFKRFGTSGAAGALTGNISGFVLVMMGGSDAVGVVLGLVLMCLQVPLVARLAGGAAIELASFRGDDHRPLPRTRGPHEVHRMDLLFMALPVVLVFTGELAFQSIKGVLAFILPFMLEASGTASHWVYLVVLGQQATQIIAIVLSAPGRAGRAFWLAVAGMGGMIAILVVPGLHDMPVAFALAVASSGLLCGFIYAFSTRMLLVRARRKEGFSRVSMNELVGGIGFGVFPFFAGFVADVSMTGVVLLVIIIAITSLVMFLAGRVVAWRREHAGIMHVIEHFAVPPRAGIPR